MRVTYFHRRPGAGHHSIEGAFEVLIAHLGPEVTARVHVARFQSRGVWRRLLNLLEAPWHQGEVNHITGDIHYVALLLLRRRTVLTIHDIGTYHELTGWRRRLFRLLWIAMPIRRSAMVTVPSAATRDDVLAVSGCPPAKVRVIPTPLSPIFTPSPRPFPEARPTILAVGTAPNKNVDRLIAALAGIDCHLEVVGVLTPEQRRALHESGIGYRESAGLDATQMVTRYRDADLVAFVSTSEGFGLPILEAQAVGRPVVTSDRSSLPEVAGAGACLVDPFDVADIRRGLRRVIAEPEYRARLLTAGFENVRRFSAAAAAAQFQALYHEIRG